jgi:hypothetical protein
VHFDDPRFSIANERLRSLTDFNMHIFNQLDNQ